MGAQKLQIYQIMLIMNLQHRMLKKNTDCGEGNEDSTTDKFETKVIKSNLCDDSYAYILVTGNITATGGDANIRNAFEKCAPFTKCITHINDEHFDNADNLDIVMPKYNLIEYSHNYSDTSEVYAV